MARLALIALLLWTVAMAETRHYFRVEPSAMAQNFHTHVEVTGRVTLSKREGDGDWHMRLEDAKGFITAECIPEIPCPHPKVGQCVRVRGLSRFDDEHKWYEVHPVEKLEVVPCRAK